MIVLGITGLARSGKDTAADVLVEQYGFTRKSFAAPLKEMVRKLDPFIGAHTRNIFTADDLDTPVESYPEGTRLSDAAVTLDENQLKEAYPEYRRLLQVLGTDCIRSLDEDFWTRAAAKELTDPDGRYVFTDCRFPNEAQLIRDLAKGSTVTDLWNIHRPLLVRGDHPSEQHSGRMKERLTLHNNGSIVQFRTLVQDAAQSLLGRQLGAAA